jgi:hypothetical protein
MHSEIMNLMEAAWFCCMVVGVGVMVLCGLAAIFDRN